MLIFWTWFVGTSVYSAYLSHQLGSFTGVWLGGLIFDATGNYDIIWRFAIGLGITSALLHLPINDRPVDRLSKIAT